MFFYALVILWVLCVCATYAFIFGHWFLSEFCFENERDCFQIVFSAALISTVNHPSAELQALWLITYNVSVVMFVLYLSTRSLYVFVRYVKTVFRLVCMCICMRGKVGAPCQIHNNKLFISVF